MGTPAAKVAVIGIDAANWALIEQWADAGVLPHLRSLMSRGVVGRTAGIEGFFVGSTWPSFSTGVTPARHGFHYLLQLEPGSYEFYRPATDRLGRHPFWRHLSDAGRRVAVLDVPLSRIDASLNGVHVVEWGGHDSAYGFHASPPAIAASIRSEFGPYPLGPSCDGARRTRADYESFLDALLRGVRLKTDLTKRVLRQGGWDLFMQVFTESHCVGHQCWHLHDLTHPAHDASIAAALGDPLRRIYVAIDAAVGELLAEIGDALVVIVSPHGMSYWYGAQFLLTEILLRLGAAEPAHGARARRGDVSRVATAVARRTWRALPASLRRAVGPLGAGMRAAVRAVPAAPTIGVDRASRCFPQHNGFPVGGIRLNLVGREPGGVLDPGAPADAFAAQLANDLLDIVDERTGKPLVRRVLRSAGLYHGEHVDRLPDLLVEWSDDVPTGSTAVGRGAAAAVLARSEKIGRIEGVNQYCRTGEHRPDGFFIAAGPTVRPQRLGRRVPIVDFAPTFVRLLGVDAPAYDGGPIGELLGAAPEAAAGAPDVHSLRWR